MRKALFWTALGGAFLLTVLACWTYWVFVIAPMDRGLKLAGTLRQAFEESLQLTPRITVNQAVVVAQNTPVLELVTLQREALVRHRLRETWLGSTKEFEIEAPFTAKAGLSLQQPFLLEIRHGGRETRVDMPPAKLLSLEMGDLKILRDEGGFWNQLQAIDRERAIRDLRIAARREILATDFLPEAHRHAQERIAQIVQLTGSVPVFADSKAPATPSSR